MYTQFGSKMVAVVVVVGCTFGTLSAHAQLLSSFENNLSMNGGTAVWEISPAHEFTGVGATDGSSALEFHHPRGWGDGSYLILRGQLPLAQLVASNQFMLFDATTMDIGEAGDGLAPGFRQVFVIYNSSSGGWQQYGAFDIPVAADDGLSATSQVTLDLTAGLSANAQAFVDGGGTGYWEMFLVFQGSDQGPVAGDYNNDGSRSAADYTVWRDNFGGTTLTNETVSPGIVDQADYDEWKANFNIPVTITTIVDNFRFVNGGAGSVSASAAPEPSSALLALAGVLALGVSRRKRQ